MMKKIFAVRTTQKILFFSLKSFVPDAVSSLLFNLVVERWNYSDLYNYKPSLIFVVEDQIEEIRCH